MAAAINLHGYVELVLLFERGERFVEFVQQRSAAGKIFFGWLAVDGNSPLPAFNAHAGGSTFAPPQGVEVVVFRNHIIYPSLLRPSPVALRKLFPAFEL